jgi:hypothetical protein
MAKIAIINGFRNKMFDNGGHIVAIKAGGENF